MPYSLTFLPNFNYVILNKIKHRDIVVLPHPLLYLKYLCLFLQCYKFDGNFPQIATFEVKKLAASIVLVLCMLIIRLEQLKATKQYYKHLIMLRLGRYSRKQELIPTKLCLFRASWRLLKVMEEQVVGLTLP